MDSGIVANVPSTLDTVNQSFGERRSVSEPYIIARKPVSGQVAPHGQGIISSAIASTPLNKPGKPQNYSPATAWPLKESVIAPVQTTAVPKYSSGKTHDSLVPSNRTSSNTTKPDSSPTKSSVSKYNFGDGLGSAKPLQRAGTQRSILANTSGEMHELIVSGTAAPALPPRSSSRAANSARATGLRTPSTGMPQLKFHEPPAVPSPSVTPSQSVHRPRYMKSFTRSHQNLATAAAFTPNRQKKEKPLPSPIPTTNSVASGKGVIKNIRNLFHKRTNLHNSLHGSVYQHPESSAKERSDMISSPFSPVIISPPLSSQVPRSPRVKGTSSISNRRDLKAEIKGTDFPANRVIRPFASSSPAPTDVYSSPPSIIKPEKTETTTPTPITTLTRTDAKPTFEQSTAMNLEPEEIRTATNLAHQLLEMTQPQPFDPNHQLLFVAVSFNFIIHSSTYTISICSSLLLPSCHQSKILGHHTRLYRD